MATSRVRSTSSAVGIGSIRSAGVKYIIPFVLVSDAQIMGVVIPIRGSLPVSTMPKGPKGQKRPADVVSNAVHVMKIATGETDEPRTDDGKNAAAVALGRRGGLARAKRLTARRRSEIARKGAKARHSK